jgi:hypothetical protein
MHERFLSHNGKLMILPPSAQHCRCQKNIVCVCVKYCIRNSNQNMELNNDLINLNMPEAVWQTIICAYMRAFVQSPVKRE